MMITKLNIGGYNFMKREYRKPKISAEFIDKQDVLTASGEEQKNPLENFIDFFDFFVEPVDPQ